VLSAISPEMMPAAIRNVSSVMRPGALGRVLVRDYAAGDLAQERFAAKDNQRLSENFYVRGDGTRAYYFTGDSLTVGLYKFNSVEP
jgi:methyltransferase-like protein 6